MILHRSGSERSGARRRRVTGLALAFGIAVVTACGNDDGNRAGTDPASAETTASDPTAATEATDGTAAPSSDTTTAPGGTDGDGASASNGVAADPDGVVKFYFSAAGVTFDPHKQPATLYNTWLSPIYDTLLTLNTDGNVIPNLATDWEVSADGTTLTMTLVEGATFPDGTPFDAAAVKSSLERAQTVEGSTLTDDLASITAIDTPDESTVVLTVENGAAALPAILTGTPGMIVNPSQADRPDLDINPVDAGMGRFVFVSHTPGDKTEYTANPSYWNADAPPIGGLEIWESTEDTARINAVLSDPSFDMTFSRGLTLDEWTDDGFDIDSTVSTTAYMLHLNTSDELADTQVRQAVAMAIDKPTLVELAFPTGGCAPTDQAYPSTVFGASPNVGADFVSYDPAMAETLLAEAGVGDLAFTLETVSRGAYVSLAEVIQQNLQQVGIDTSITQSAFPESRQKFLDGDADMLVTIQFSSADPSQDLALYALADSPWNPGGYVPAELPGIADAALSSSDVDERAALYAEAAELMAEEVTPYIPICNGETTVAYRSDQLGGLELYPDGIYRWNTVYKVAE